jgi:hypothetical protein
MQADLALLGNFGAVYALRDDVVAEKEAILAEKCAGFIPTAKEELIGLLINYLEKSKGSLEILKSKDRQALIELKNEVNRHINAIRSDLQVAAGEWLSKIETQKMEGIRELRNSAKESQSVDERTATETKVGTRTWTERYGFLWLFKRTRSEEYTYEESYSYVAASDAADSIRNFVRDGESHIEHAFTQAISHQEMKRRLLNIVASNFDMADERYDASLFRLIVEEQIKKIEFPVIKVDCSAAINSIATKFNGKIRDSKDQSALRNALAGAVDTAFSALMSGLEQAASSFKTDLSNICDDLQNTLLKDMNVEFEDLLKKLDEKEASINRLSVYANELEKAISEVRK